MPASTFVVVRVTVVPSRWALSPYCVWARSVRLCGYVGDRAGVARRGQRTREQDQLVEQVEEDQQAYRGGDGLVDGPHGDSVDVDPPDAGEHLYAGGDQQR